MTHIYATAPVPPIAERAFASLGPVRVLDADWSDLDRAEILLVRAERLDAAAIERAASLRLIARTGSGVDQVDVGAATRRGIPVVYAPSAGARPVAEGTIALMLAAMKRLGELGQVLRDGTWPERYRIEILDINGATLGIIGFGRIGREVARLATSLGMKVIAFDPNLTTSVDGVALVGLDELLERSDVVSIHCPLNDRTRSLIDREAIGQLKPGAVLVNVARGEIVGGDELLIEALDSGRISAVALDVFAQEPPRSTSPLLSDPRIVSSPHAIGLTGGWNERVFETLAADAERFLRGEVPSYVVDPAALDPAPQT